jgi:hypothetical protein
LGEYVRRQQNCDFAGIILFLSQISAAFRPTRAAEVPVADDFVRVSSQTEMGKKSTIASTHYFKLLFQLQQCQLSLLL